jgi:HMG-box domain
MRSAPSRPLSAYNFFFREKRHEWICQADQEGSDLAAAIESNTSSPSSDAAVARLTNADRAAVETKKKAGTPRRFEAMARDMGSRWRALPVCERKKYADLAATDQTRYRQEMVEYRDKIIRESTLGAAYLQRKESAARAAEQQADSSRQSHGSAREHGEQSQSKDQSVPAVVTTAAQQDREAAQMPTPSDPSTGFSSTAPTSSAPSAASSRSAMSPTASQQVGASSRSAMSPSANQQVATSVGGTSTSAFETTQRINSIQEQMRALEEMQRLIDQNSASQLQDNSTPFGMLQQRNPNTGALGGNPSNPLPSLLDGMNANQLQTHILLLQLQNAAQQQQRQEEQNMRQIQETLSQILQQQNQSRPERQQHPNQRQSTSSQGIFLLQQQLQLPPEQRMLPSAHNILSQQSTCFPYFASVNSHNHHSPKNRNMRVHVPRSRQRSHERRDTKSKSG